MPDIDQSAYFDDLQSALLADQRCQPLLMIDRRRLDANIETMVSTVPDGMAVRVVAKSLPSVPLLSHVMDGLGTDRLMTFNLPMLLALANEMPFADQLLGKPFPVAAADQFMEQVPAAAVERVQWLIDTNERLEQYESLARQRAMTLRVSLELDIGLHRGGFSSEARLRAALQRVESCEFLELSGLMGYEAHLAKMPAAGGLRQRGFDAAMRSYARALEIATEVFGPEVVAHLTNNCAGSLTYPLHGHDSVANEISIGTTLLKGTDFDTDLLEGFVPAVFIAAPVLKVLAGVELPGIERLGRVAGRLRRRPRRAVFIHGGHWLAKAVHPVGLSTSALYGRSSNQEMLLSSEAEQLRPDDFVFLRPTQTEAVLLQFGDIAIYEDGAVVDNWQVFPPSA